MSTDKSHIFNDLSLTERLKLKFKLAARLPSAHDRQIISELWRSYDRISDLGYVFSEVEIFYPEKEPKFTMRRQMLNEKFAAAATDLPTVLDTYRQFHDELAAHYDQAQRPELVRNCHDSAALYGEAAARARQLSPRMAKFMGADLLQNRTRYLPFAIA